MNNIKEVLESGDVMRFHACPHMIKQNMSSHEWGVAVLCKHLKEDITADELMIALTHDSCELITGDIPATLKWTYPEVKQLLNKIEDRIDLLPAYECSKDFKYILKLADYLEGIIYCYNCAINGNNQARIIYLRWVPALLKYIDDNIDHISSTAITKASIILSTYKLEDTKDE